jgi:transposase
LVPSVYKSCETEYYGRITKSGDKLLRWLLVESAHILLTRSGTPCELKEWGLRLQKAKGVGKARVAVARRLCGIMLQLWKSGEVFHAESLNQAA